LLHELAGPDRVELMRTLLPAVNKGEIKVDFVGPLF
jgi:hypothetical protein